MGGCVGEVGGGCVDREDEGGGGDVGAVFGEGRVVDGGVPVAALPAADGVGEHLGEVVGVGEGGEAEGGFQEGRVGGVVDEDVVDDVDKFGVGGDAVGRAVFANGFVVLPEVPDGFGDTGGGDDSCGFGLVGKKWRVFGG